MSYICTRFRLIAPLVLPKGTEWRGLFFASHIIKKLIYLREGYGISFSIYIVFY